MTQDIEISAFNNVMAILTESGFDGMADALAVLMNEAMKLDRDYHLGAGPWERSKTRCGYANGFKPKQVQTRIGTLPLQIPQTRDTDFYPSSLERGLRSERALKTTLAQMYVQGVSTRKVANITQKLCGFEVTSAQVSRAVMALDEELIAWRERPLGCMPMVILDARYEQIRYSSRLIDCAVLMAIGINEQGKRQILGCSVALSEAEVHWRDFLSGLKQRGLHGVELLISDAHEGLKAARKAVFSGVPWQRCQFHLQQNAQAYVPKKEMKAKVAEQIRRIFDAPDREDAQRLLDKFIECHEKKAPDLARWAQTAIPEGLEVFAFPASQRKRLRTSNLLERVNREIKRRTPVATLFPNTESCLRLVSAVLMEISEEWETGRAYINMNPDDNEDTG